MRAFRLPPLRAILDLHDAWIAGFGGAAGLRDLGALEASLARAHQILGYEPDTDTTHLAAAICASLCRNHPFVDGNKRAAFGTLGVVLILNGLYLDVAESEATAVMLSLAAGEMAEDDFRAWVAANSHADVPGLP